VLAASVAVALLPSSAMMRAALGQATQSGTTPTAKLVGTITDTTGVPLSRAEIWLLTEIAHRAISDDSGKFELRGLPAGNVTFAVRRLGYESATFSAVLHVGRTHRATFPLTPSAQSVEGVTVVDTASHWLQLFDAHRASHHGTFIKRRDFENIHYRVASDILRMVPGVEVMPTRNGTQIVMARGAGARRCVPQLYVHTTPYSGNFDDFVPDDIEALEVYIGVSEVPPDLQRMGRGICGAIVIWTREPPPIKK
jgi:hypothetical protein